MIFDIALNPLNRADGSASLTQNGYSVIASVNGPLEVQKRDEIPDEAAIEVAVRPSAGVGGIREKHFETILHRTLKRIIKTREHPRTLIQVMVQVTALPESKFSSGRVPQAYSVRGKIRCPPLIQLSAERKCDRATLTDRPCWRIFHPQKCLDLLPPILNASTLALLTTSIPLDMVMTSVLITVSPKEYVKHSPSQKELDGATSSHALAISSRGRILVAESEGPFSAEQWEQVVVTAKLACRGETPPTTMAPSDGSDMGPNREGGIEQAFKEALRRQIAIENSWKGGVEWE